MYNMIRTCGQSPRGIPFYSDRDARWKLKIKPGGELLGILGGGVPPGF